MSVNAIRNITHSSNYSSPMIVAHRGLHTKYEENTIDAFKAAASEPGIDMIELDVRKTSDHHLVIYHNPALDTNRPWISHRKENKHKLVKDHTYAQIKDACEERGFTPPLLEDALKACEGKAIDIEIKVPGIEDEVWSLVKKLGLKNRVILTSFFDIVVFKLKDMGISAPTGLILGAPQIGAKKLLSEIFPLKRLNLCGADIVVPYRRLCRPHYIRTAHKHGRKVFVWTVNHRSTMRRLVRAGVDAIITDNPLLAVETLGL